MILSVLVICLILENLVIIQNFAEGTVVQTNYGKVKGSVQFSRSNRTFYAFKGIPYAQPPIGELRFKAPLPPNSWKNVRDATKDGPVCIQKNYLLSEHPPVEGKEDCLHLNVYTPKLPDDGQWNLPANKVLLPVMVFIHYGGFFAGTGNSDYLGPEYFLDKDVVLVTFNYRLGVFGFFSTCDDVAPGNWGLKDQVLALKWVQNNIIYFGGNNKKVTIFGQSAGAGCVHYHLLSPTTKNLFHSAISQSGTSLGLWARPQNDIQKVIAVHQGRFVGCPIVNDNKLLVECLRKVNAEVLANSSDSFKFFSTEPFVLYGPVVEKCTYWNQDPYITEDPLELVKKGKFHKIPWIIGGVSDEGILRAAPLLRQPHIQSALNEKFDEYGPKIFAVSISVSDDRKQKTWDKIANFFLDGKFVNITEPNSVQGFIDLYSDRAFNYANYQSALVHARNGHHPIWFYHFAYKGEYSYGEHFAITQNDFKFKWGVSHCDDLIYLFPSKKLFKPLKSYNDILMSNIMIEMWTNFADFRNPTPLNGVKNIRWQPVPDLKGKKVVKNSDLVYLNISGPYKSEQSELPIRLELANQFYPERMHFWESLPLSENIEGVN